MFGIRRFSLPVLAAAGLALGLAATVSAQSSTERPRGPRYDLTTEATVTGVIQAVELVEGSGRGRRGLGGTHLRMASGPDTLEVHLGPTAFLKTLKVELAAGDVVEVVGSRVTVDGAPVWLARTVTKNGQAWTLRDSAGLPLWRGGRTRR